MLAVVVTGLVVVFAALVLLVGAVSCFNLFKKKEKSQPSAQTAKTVKTSSTPAPIIEEGISDEVVAVISAAIAAMTSESGKSFAIRSIKQSKPQRPVWAFAGLQDNTRPF